jgi:hypothetical protein
MCGSERIEVAPVLPHAAVRRDKGEEHILMKQQAIGFCSYGLLDFLPKPGEYFQTPNGIQTHSQIDHDHIGILRKIDGATVNVAFYDVVLNVDMECLQRSIQVAKLRLDNS